MENPNAILWIPRAAGDLLSPEERYTEKNKRFVSITTVHDGYFKRRGGMRYTGNLMNTFDFIDAGDISFGFMENMLRFVGFQGRPFFYYQIPHEEFDYGLIRLETTVDFARFQCTLWPQRWKQTPIIYAEPNIATIQVSYPKSALDASRQKMIQFIWPCMSKKPHMEAEGAQMFLRKKYGIPLPLRMIEAVKDETVVAIWGKRKQVWDLGS